MTVNPSTPQKGRQFTQLGPDHSQQKGKVMKAAPIVTELGYGDRAGVQRQSRGTVTEPGYSDRAGVQ